jgi:hypothetical protein
MAAIANATVSRRNAGHFATLNQLIKKFKKFSAAVYDNNARFRLLMCSDQELPYSMAYEAARNALAQNGIDYSNGGCFWDGTDIKTMKDKHYRYLSGFKFKNIDHNIFSILEPPPRHKISINGKYDYAYESTAAYGSTIFWKYTESYMKAT